MCTRDRVLVGVNGRVVIVGAGPVGLTAAVALAQKGVPVEVLEAGKSLSANSRASTFHPPTLEMLEVLGAYEPLAEIGLRAETFQYWNRSGELIAEFNLRVLAGDTRFPYRIQCEQNKLTPILLYLLRRTERGDVRFGAEVESVRIGTDRATAALTTGEEIVGSFLVAADGAQSTVRKSLGIAYDGMTYDQRYLVISASHPLESILPGLAPVSYVSDPDQWLALIRVPEHWRILLPLVTDEPIGSSEALALGKGFAPDLAAGEVVDFSAYSVHQRVAATFRLGRALLAGDAAHINSPLGGMGMNSGIHDAVHLAAALAKVWQGRGGEGLLDDYADRRSAIALEYIASATDQHVRNLALRDPELRAGRDRELRTASGDPDLARRHLLKSSMIESLRTERRVAR